MLCFFKKPVSREMMCCGIRYVLCLQMFFRFIYTLPQKYLITSNHQVSHAGNFSSPGLKYKRLTTYLVTSRWLCSRWKNLFDGEVIGDSWNVEIISSRFLQNWFWIVPASTKSCLTQVSELAWKESKNDRCNQ